MKISKFMETLFKHCEPFGESLELYRKIKHLETDKTCDLIKKRIEIHNIKYSYLTGGKFRIFKEQEDVFYIMIFPHYIYKFVRPDSRMGGSWGLIFEESLFDLCQKLGTENMMIYILNASKLKEIPPLMDQFIVGITERLEINPELFGPFTQDELIDQRKMLYTFL